MSDVHWRASPNHTERRGGGVPVMVVLHYTGMESADSAIDRLCDPTVEVSAHYLIDSHGRVTQMVEEDRRAWHAGRSGWGGIEDVNSWSIGIELANEGPLCGFPPFPEPMMRATEDLLGTITQRWQIAPERVLGHACIAPGRKIDPGTKFDWRRLALGGNAVWMAPPLLPGTGAADAARFRQAARVFGYRVGQCIDESAEEWTPDLLAVWEAFALRFLAPTPLASSGPCPAGIEHLEALAERWPAVDPAGV